MMVRLTFLIAITPSLMYFARGELPNFHPTDHGTVKATVPRGRVYTLSLPEQKAMEEYVKEALEQGYIRPSTSPAASSFFFVQKKDGGL